MKVKDYDFAGWATKNDLLCSDGRTIKKNAFKHMDGKTVPLVWQHQHGGPENVLGHALLENRDEGVWTYGSFNSTEDGQRAKHLVAHGDITQLSIWANKLTENGGDVLHGDIKEVSLVMAGANPGAYIENVYFAHSDELDESSGIIYTGENIYLAHADDDDEDEEETKVAKDNNRTMQDVYDSLNDEQKDLVSYLVGEALSEGDSVEHRDRDDDEEDEEDPDVDIDDEDNDETDDDDEDDEENPKKEKKQMKHNIFETENNETGVLSHDQLKAFATDVFTDLKRYGSFKDSFMAHADDYGIKTRDGIGIEALFPEFRNLNKEPEFIKRDTDWVSKVMSGVHRSPFSRIKSMFADITEDEARAKGYMKGNLKKEEVFTLLRRTTDPQTIYKKQKLDRDDIIDITDFDVVAWLRREMRMMLEEEIARAILIGDGRSTASPDKISEDHVRSIYNDSELFVVKVEVNPGADDQQTAKAIVRNIIKNRKNYKGSGSPTFFANEDYITEMLLIEDGIGHYMYETETALSTKLRVKEIVPVEVMESFAPESGNKLVGIIVNLNDYNVGADRGGDVTMFNDFDIDYNQEKYLIETRISGALTKPYSAIVVEVKGSNG